MLIEVKTKVARVIDGKTRKRTETFLADKEFFAEAEYMVTAQLNNEITQGTVENFEIQSLRISAIREVTPQFGGQYSYIATLIDIFLTDDGAEKRLKYKILLWADSLTEANNHASQLARQGYDLQIEGIKQVDYEYLHGIPETSDNQEGNING